MTFSSKLCDAADWFRPGIHAIITGELHETPRFHRKQWEFAMILHALRNNGRLDPGCVGLSMGGGRELVLYAIARQVRHLMVTDLYDAQSSWDCARTGDPDQFIHANKPILVDDERFHARRMDMRELAFPDRSFDFAYSTCAVEHIGTREDVIHHFNEVARVLKDDGMYVVTTEIGYQDVTIEDEHNMVFSLDDFLHMVEVSNLVAEPEFDARILPHQINSPTLSNLAHLSFSRPSHLSEALSEVGPHLHLLRGEYPFTCGIFLLRKRTNDTSRRVHIIGLEDSRIFMQDQTFRFSRLLHDNHVSLHPYSWLPFERSWYCSDHQEFFGHHPSGTADTETAFHTDYFWWGTGMREFLVNMEPEAASTDTELEIRIHAYRTVRSGEILCIVNRRISPERGSLTCRLHLSTSSDMCYAILGKVRQGNSRWKQITISSAPVGGENDRDIPGRGCTPDTVAAGPEEAQWT